jgi:hypothetical protein
MVTMYKKSGGGGNIFQQQNNLNSKHPRLEYLKKL